ncbi:uncharacterized protein LOC130673970 [Microplitis mediator]|uniref:uncharacterized protein LOC130673970 n=1 Tax=Microplitis mediator TaxID=375433 RepID=UPI00255759FA|nr:uncharacterized protein LOC130673970 [Microplitis mediator]
MNALEIFPVEIWEIIINKLDNRELLKLRYVSDDLNKIIERIIIKKKLWEKLFRVNAIPWINQIIAKRFPTVKQRQWRSLYQSIWKQLLFSYIKWRFFGNSHREIIIKSCNISKQLMKNEKITCFDVWVSVLAIGTNTGSIYFYNIKEISSEPFYATNHREHVTQIKLWYLGFKKLIAVSTSVNGKLKFWNIHAKNEILTSQQYYGKNICVGLNRRLFVENSFTIKEYSSDSIQITPKAAFEVYEIDQNDPEFEFLSMYSEKDKLQVLIEYSSAVIILFYKISQHDPVFPVIADDFYPLRGRPVRLGPDDVFDFDFDCTFHISNMTVTIIAHAGFLSVRVENSNVPSIWKTHKIPLAENVTVTSTVMFANLLFIGLSTGNINVYAVGNIADLLDNNLIFKNLRTIELDIFPIIALNLTEIKKVPYIIASTESKLYSVNIINI